MRKEKKYNYIYKITNIKNNKYYIGMHSTNNLDDGYFGSGKRLWYSINYHGRENHEMEILEYLPTRKLLKVREKELVNENLLSEELCMNLALGGGDGFGYINVEKLNNKVNQCRLGGKAFKEKLSNDTEFRKIHIENVTKNLIKAHQEGKIKYNTFEGKNHSEQSKSKISKSMKGKGLGKLNSQYGCMWITNETDNKKISKDSLIPEGWRRGRTIKKIK